MLDTLEDLQRKADNTKNPVYVWRALAEWFANEDSDPRPVKERAPLPTWLCGYVSIWARRVEDLAAGRDYRIAPMPFGDLPMEWASVLRARRRQRTLEPPEATRLILHALGFKGSGWGAFRQARRLEEQDIEALSIDGFKNIVGIGDAESFDAMLDDHGNASNSVGGNPSISEERGSRKRIQKSRNARRSKPT